MRGREIRTVLLLAIFAFVLVGSPAPRPALAQEVSPTPTPTQLPNPEVPTPSPVVITYPVAGLKLAGVVKITGTIAVDGWSSYELDFAYASDTTNTWFSFAGGNNPPAGGSLAAWDTTKLSDGDYNLRLRVFSAGAPQDGFAYGLRIRNYTADTPAPTLTPPVTATATMPTATLVPSSTPTLTPTVYPTPTALPANPAALGTGEIVLNLSRGALLTIFLFGAFGIFLRLRRR
jgi:hypothetical protein